MGLQLKPAKRRIDYKDATDDIVATGDLTVSGNLTVAGTLTSTGLVVPAVTGSASTFTVGADLIVTTTTAMAGNCTITAAATPTLATTDTTNTVTNVHRSNDTVGQVGTTTAHALELLANGTARIAIASAGTITVSGATTFSGVNVTLSGASTPTLTITDTTATVSVVARSNDTVGQIGTSTTHSLEVLTDGTARLTITGAGAATFAGALTSTGAFVASSTAAITGAVTMASTLTVSGAAMTLTNASSPVFTVTDTTNTVSTIVSSDNSTGIIGTSTAHSLLIKTNGTTAITIDSSQAITFAGAVTITGAQTFTGAATFSSTVTASGLITGPALTLTGASGVVLTATDSTTPCTCALTMADTTATFGTTTNHSLILRTNNATAVTIAGTGVATFAATPVAPALTLSGASGVVLTMTDTSTPSTLTITMADTTATIATTTAHSLILSANGNTGLTIASTGIITVAQAAVFTLGMQAASVARTATSDGLTTGLIATGTSFVAVTAASANDIITLPTSAPVGTIIRGWVGANGHEIRTTASSNETINNVDADGTNEAAIPATTLWEVTKVSSTAWILRAWDELGAPITAIVPDP